MWDWTTSILKAQVRRRERLKAGLLVPLGSSHTPQCHPGPPVPIAHCLPQHDDQQSVALRRRSSSHLARQKFGTMPLLPIRGDDSGATLLSANQTLVRPYSQHVLSICSLSSSLPIAGGKQCACMPDAPPPHRDPLVHSLRALTSRQHLLLPGLTLSLSLPPLIPTLPGSSGDYTTGGPYPCSL